MISSVIGTTILSRALARSMYSNWAAPGDVIAGREFHLRRHRLLRVGHVTADIAVAQVDIDIGGKLRVLGADGGWPLGEFHLGHFAGGTCRHWQRE